MKVFAVASFFFFFASALPQASSAEATSAQAEQPRVTYRKARLSDPSWKRLKKQVGPDADLLLAKINRLDMRRLKRQQTLVAPTRPVDELTCSPFPPVIAEALLWPKLVLVSLRVQAFGAYEYGQLVRWGPTSTGIRSRPTPASLYFTSSKSRRKISTLDRTWIMPWYVNLHTSMGVAFHQYSMPGRPYSHGCIRLLKEDAVWMYGWTDTWVPPSDQDSPQIHGTPVIVFGEYRYGKKPPWAALPKDPLAASVSQEEIAESFGRYAGVIDERVRARQAHFAAQAAEAALETSRD